jgi:hypothetical protein
VSSATWVLTFGGSCCLSLHGTGVTCAELNTSVLKMKAAGPVTLLLSINLVVGPSCKIHLGEQTLYLFKKRIILNGRGVSTSNRKLHLCLQK